MEIRLHRDPGVFDALTAPLYAADPVTHTVALTVLAQPGRQFRSLLTVHQGGVVVGAAFRRPGRPLGVSGLPEEAAAGAVSALLRVDPGLDGVAGPRRKAEAVARAWAGATGGGAHPLVAHRLFRLAELAEPGGVPGRARLAGPDDLDASLALQRAFVAEAVPHNPPPAAAAVREQLAGGGVTVFWELDGDPVAMARASGPARGMSRISWVYTPPRRRGHGFGAAVTAAASRWALDAGCRDVVLFTDLANPVSNAIYPRLGYTGRCTTTCSSP